MNHVEPFNHLSHCAEGKLLFAVHGEEEIARHEVHALAIVNLRVDDSIGLQNVGEIVVSEVFHVVVGSLHIDVDRLFDLLGECHIDLLPVMFILRLDSIRIHSKYL